MTEQERERRGKIRLIGYRQDALTGGAEPHVLDLHPNTTVGAAIDEMRRKLGFPASWRIVTSLIEEEEEVPHD